MGKTRVALIWPDGNDPCWVIPLPYAFIVANTDPSLCEFKLFDLALGLPSRRNLDRCVADFRPDVIGITAFAMNFRQALSAARQAKRASPEAVVVAGGPHASAWTRGVMANPEIDFVIRGEAERAFGAFIMELRSRSPRWGKVPGLAWRHGDKIVEAVPAVVDDLDSLALPDYRFIRFDQYLQRGYRLQSDEWLNAPIQTTRGCPLNCAFCGGPAVNGHALRHFSIGYVMRWIKMLHRDFGIRWFNIIDDTFTHDLSHAKRFCREVERLGLPGLKFGTPNGVRMQRSDPELWQMMRRAGFVLLTVAPESGSTRVLRLMGKGLRPEEVEPIVRQIRSAGLRVQAFFMVGFPGETREDIERTIELIRRCRFDNLHLFSFQPIPGTPAFSQLVAAGAIGEDFLPATYFPTEQRYVSPELRGLNVPWLFFKIRLSAALREPVRFLRHLKFTDPWISARRFFWWRWQ